MNIRHLSREKATGMMWIAYHLAQLVSFIFYKKWVQGEKYPNHMHQY